MDLSYRIEKRLVLSPERCPECGRRARHMVEESHVPGKHGVAWDAAPHIAQEFRCLSGHRWRRASYDGQTFAPVGAHSPADHETPRTPLQRLTEGIPLWFLILGGFIMTGAIVALLAALVVLVWLAHG